MVVKEEERHTSMRTEKMLSLMIKDFSNVLEGGSGSGKSHRRGDLDRGRQTSGGERDVEAPH